MTVSKTEKQAPEGDLPEAMEMIAIDDLRISRGGPLSDEEIDDLVAFTYANRQRETCPALARGERRIDRPHSTFEELRAQALRHNPFESDQEVDDFIAWMHAERRRDMA
jgi:hypothetical protein